MISDTHRLMLLVLLLIPAAALAEPADREPLLPWDPIALPRRDAPPEQDSRPGPEHVITRDLRTGITTRRPAREARFAPPANMTFGQTGVLPPGTDRGGPQGNFSAHSPTPDPTVFPYRTHVRLRMLFVTSGGDSSLSMCSGTLIGPRHVVTAGHCAIKENGLWATRIEVVPAFDNFSKPFGNAFAVQIHSWQGWSDDADLDHDVALLDLDRPVGALTGWRGYGYNSDCDFFTGGTWERHGYPAEDGYNGLVMHTDSGDYDGCDTAFGDWYGYEVWADRPGIGGTSGSGAVRNGNVYAVRSNTSFDLLNGYDSYDTRLTSGKFSDIQGWIAEDTPGSPDLSPLTLTLSHASRSAGEYLSTTWLLAYNHSTAGFNGPVSGTAYLSTDNQITPGDIPLGTFTVSKTIGAFGGDWVGLPGWQIPVGTPPGGYFVGVILSTADANAANNVTYPTDAAPLVIGCVEPDAPTLLDPAGGSGCEPSPVTMRWSAMPGALSYRLTIRRGFSTSFLSLLGTEFQMNLPAGEYVSWSVEAEYACSGATVYSPPSPTRSFIVETATPQVPALDFPPDGATCTSKDVDLDWQSTTSSGEWDEYHVWWGYDCTTPVSIDSAPYSFHELAGLLPDTEYFWKVRGRNQCGVVGPWSECRSFRTAAQPLAAPSPTWPAHQATCIDTLGPTVAWDPVPGTESYRVTFGADCFDNGDTAWTVGGGSTNSTLPPVTGGTTYFWSVVAVDSCGQDGVSSPCREFTTRPVPSLPPIVLSPAPGACSPPDVVLTWQPVAGADQYQVQMAGGFCSFPFPTTTYSTGANSLIVPGRPEGTHMWRIRSRGPCGTWGPWSGCSPVTVDATPPGAIQGLTSSSHTTGDWSSNPVISLSWQDPAGEPCPVDYSIEIDEQSGTVPDVAVDLVGDPSQPVTYDTSPLTSGSGYWIHIRPVDAGDQTGPTTHLGPFPIDTVQPMMAVDQPEGFEVFAPGEAVPIAWTTSDAHSGVFSVRIEFSADDGDTWDVIHQMRAFSSSWGWTAPDTSCSDCWIRVIAVDDAGNEGEGWTDRPFSIVPQTGIGDESPVAGAVASAGRPNPFRAGTTVSVDLKEAERVRAAVFDASGRRIRTLDAGSWSAGRHEVRWDGTDDQGRGVRSGVYFLRLEIAGGEIVRRVLRIR